MSQTKPKTSQFEENNFFAKNIPPPADIAFKCNKNHEEVVIDAFFGTFYQKMKKEEIASYRKYFFQTTILFYLVSLTIAGHWVEEKKAGKDGKKKK